MPPTAQEAIDEAQRIKNETDSPKVEDKADDVIANAEEALPEEGAGEPSGEEVGKAPNLLEGERVKFEDDEGKTRMGVVTSVVYASTEDYLQAMTPGHPRRAFANVTAYVVTTRDAKAETLTVPVDKVDALSVIDGWGRCES